MSDDSRALVPLQVMPPPAAKSLPDDREMQMIVAIADRAVKAKGMIPSNVQSADQAFAIMLAGFELGCKPITALRHIFVVNGKTEPDAQLMMGLVLAADPTARFIFHERTRKVADIELTRAGREPLRIRITLEEVGALGKKTGPWTQYPADMLGWHVIKRLCRLGAADAVNAIAGMHTADAAELASSVREVAPTEALPAPSAEPTEAELVNEGDIARNGESTAPEPLADESQAPAAEAGPSARDLFTAWLVDRGIENIVPQWLGLATDCEEPFTRYWLEPAVAGGLTEAQAFAVAQLAMQAMLDKVKELQGTTAPLQTALELIQPLERLKAALDEHDTAEEKDEADVGGTQPESGRREAQAAAEDAPEPTTGAQAELAP